MSEGRLENQTAASAMKALLSSSRIVDLTVTMAPDLPVNPADEVPMHLNLNNYYNWPMGPFMWHFVSMDDHTGTHCDAPCHFVPPSLEDCPDLSAFASEAGAASDAEVGSSAPPPAVWPPAGFKYELPDTPAATVDKIPIEQIMGPAAVIDVRHLNDTVPPGRHTVLERSPIITVDEIQRWEQQHGDLEPGDVVLFRTGWLELYYRRFPEGYKLDRSHPGLVGETVHYLADRGVETIGIDAHGPGLLHDDFDSHWALGIRGMVMVEKVNNLAELPPRGAFFIFLPWKIEGISGGVGRAIAIV